MAGINKDKDLDSGRDKRQYFAPEFIALFKRSLSLSPSFLFIENKISP